VDIQNTLTTAAVPTERQDSADSAQRGPLATGVVPRWQSTAGPRRQRLISAHRRELGVSLEMLVGLVEHVSIDLGA